LGRSETLIWFFGCASGLPFMWELESGLSLRLSWFANLFRDFGGIFYFFGCSTIVYWLDS
jgi:hypothetical protein